MEDILSKLNDSVPSAKARSRSVLPGPGRWKKRDKGGVYIVNIDLANRRNVENRSFLLQFARSVSVSQSNALSIEFGYKAIVATRTNNHRY